MIDIDKIECAIVKELSSLLTIKNHGLNGTKHSIVGFKGPSL